MIHVVQLDVPRCPNCSALMFYREQSNHMQYLSCYHCGVPYMIVGDYKSDKEILVTDNINDLETLKD